MQCIQKIAFPCAVLSHKIGEWMQADIAFGNAFIAAQHHALYENGICHAILLKQDEAYP